ncbi:hypothetical protein BH18VER2_BH18VER2_07020 [soil metagenome]
MNPPSTDENHISNNSMPPRLSPKPRSKRRTKQAKPTDSSPVTEPTLPAIGTLARTRRLILAALRVWELKRGIREY